MTLWAKLQAIVADEVCNGDESRPIAAVREAALWRLVTEEAKGWKLGDPNLPRPPLGQPPGAQSRGPQLGD